MFNESKIAENHCCYVEGEMAAIRDLLFELELNDKKTISKAYLEELYIKKAKEYEKSWNIYAEKNYVGGRRYTCEGKGERI